MTGSWIACTPVFEMTGPLFGRVSDCIAHTKIDDHNRAILKVKHV